MTKKLYTRTSEDGRMYCTKGEFKQHMWNMYKNEPKENYLCPGETFNIWFEILMECMLEDGSAKKVGNHYEVYEEA